MIKMFKILRNMIIVLLIFSITLTAAFAEYNIQNIYNRHESVQERSEIREQIMTMSQMQNMTQIANRYILQSKIQERINSTVNGLENAILHVNNSVALERLHRNLERFQNRSQFRYDRYDVTEVDGETFIRAKRNFRFLIFNFNVEDEYHVDEYGNIIKQNRGWLSRLLIRKGATG